MDWLAIGKEILAQQAFSVLMGAELTHLAPGKAVIEIPVRDEFKQQHGFIHGGVLSYAADNVLTFAAGTVLGLNLLTAEFKINYLKPARGQRLVARGWVVGHGKRQAVCRCDLFSLEGGEEVLCAVAQGTILRTDKVAKEPVDSNG